MAKKTTSAGTKILSKADLLKGGGLRRELVAVPELGASVWMRQMSAQEVISFKSLIESFKLDGVKNTTFEQDVEIMTHIISLSVCDENGELILNPEEAKGLVKNDANVLAYLANKALELSKVKVSSGGFVGEAKNTLPNDPKTYSLENSQES